MLKDIYYTVWRRDDGHVCVESLDSCVMASSLRAKGWPIYCVYGHGGFREINIVKEMFERDFPA